MSCSQIASDTAVLSPPTPTPPGTKTANKLGCNLLADLALLDYFGFPSQNSHFSITVAMYICMYIVKTVKSTCDVAHTVCHTYCIHLTSSL